MDYEGTGEKYGKMTVRTNSKQEGPEDRKGKTKTETGISKIQKTGKKS